MNRYLHIVCLDVPLPADYGGAIDMFYRIRALHESGIRVHLHYFSYNHRGNPNELNRYCESISVYERNTGWKGLSRKLPYIVSSRVAPALVSSLNRDDHPVLIEGVHCTGIIPMLRQGKKIMVRIHNDESEYYRQLAGSTRNIFKKIHFARESRLLKKYQRRLPRDLFYACITSADTQRMQETFQWKNAFFLPAFIPAREVSGEEGSGNFCLYHGNLSVPENEQAAIWLLTKVFPPMKIPLVIAGKNPTRRLDKLAHLCQHTCLVANPSESEINDLVRKAHINVLPAFSTTGIKLKLLHALFSGRHCVTNPKMINGTGLEEACHVATNANAFGSIIMQLHHQPFTPEEILLRKRLLGNTFDNRKNAGRIIACLW